MKMFRVRLGCFLYALLMMLILLHGSPSIAKAHLVVGKKPSEFASTMDYERASHLIHEEKTYDEFVTGVKARNQKLGGRRILSHKTGEQKEINGDQVPSCARSTTTTRSSTGGKEKASLDEKCRSLSTKGVQDVESSRAAGFEALNSDYYQPRHHPPKNN